MSGTGTAGSGTVGTGAGFVWITSSSDESDESSMGFFFFPQPFLAGFLLGALGSGDIGASANTFGTVGAGDSGAFRLMVGSLLG